MLNLITSQIHRQNIPKKTEIKTEVIMKDFSKPNLWIPAVEN